MKPQTENTTVFRGCLTGQASICYHSNPVSTRSHPEILVGDCLPQNLITQVQVTKIISFPIVQHSAFTQIGPKCNHHSNYFIFSSNLFLPCLMSLYLLNTLNCIISLNSFITTSLPNINSFLILREQIIQIFNFFFKIENLKYLC